MFFKDDFFPEQGERKRSVVFHVSDRPTKPQGQKHFKKWGISSAGRAPALHAGGQRFDPAILHQFSRFALN